jgi:hypothetical protein
VKKVFSTHLVELSACSVQGARSKGLPSRRGAALQKNLGGDAEKNHVLASKSTVAPSNQKKVPLRFIRAFHKTRFVKQKNSQQVADTGTA